MLIKCVFTESDMHAFNLMNLNISLIFIFERSTDSINKSDWFNKVVYSSLNRFTFFYKPQFLCSCIFIGYFPEKI